MKAFSESAFNRVSKGRFILPTTGAIHDNFQQELHRQVLQHGLFGDFGHPRRLRRWRRDERLSFDSRAIILVSGI